MRKLYAYVTIQGGNKEIPADNQFMDFYTKGGVDMIHNSTASVIYINDFSRFRLCKAGNSCYENT